IRASGSDVSRAAATGAPQRTPGHGPSASTSAHSTEPRTTASRVIRAFTGLSFRFDLPQNSPALLAEASAFPAYCLAAAERDRLPFESAPERTEDRRYWLKAVSPSTGVEAELERRARPRRSADL